MFKPSPQGPMHSTHSGNSWSSSGLYQVKNEKKLGGRVFLKCFVEISGIWSRSSCQRRLQATNGVIYKANLLPAWLQEQNCTPGPRGKSLHQPLPGGLHGTGQSQGAVSVFSSSK